jgi:hypothetical protein
MTENNAVFSASGNHWPSQKAQPRGAELPAKIRISAMNGPAMVYALWLLIVWRRVDPE